MSKAKTKTDEPDVVIPRRTKLITPEQAERRALVEERTRIMSERGVPSAKTGIYAGKPKQKGTSQ